MIQWTKLERSYKALQIYVRQNGAKMEQHLPFEPNRQVLEIYKKQTCLCQRSLLSHKPSSEMKHCVMTELAA